MAAQHPRPALSLSVIIPVAAGTSPHAAELSALSVARCYGGDGDGGDEGDEDGSGGDKGSDGRSRKQNVFGAIKVHSLTEPSPAPDIAKWVTIGEQDGADWLCILQPGEELHANAFALIAPALQAYDGIWGGFAIREHPALSDAGSGDDGRGAYVGGTDRAELEKNKSSKQTAAPFKHGFYTGSSLLDLCHMVLLWWIGRSHFVRLSTLRALLDDPGAPPACNSDYLLALWRRASCLKTAQPLTCGPTPPPITDRDRTAILTFLERHPQFITFTHAGHEIKLAYSGRNPTLERLQMRGLFFEAPELHALAKLLTQRNSNPVILDVGANTGNHMVYFAKVMAARSVVIFEPNRDAIAFLHHVIAANQLTTIDTSFLGQGVGARAMSAALQLGRRGHLGTAQLTEQPGGDISIIALDDCAFEYVDLIKIDVEHMELDVLRGARKLIDRSKPILFVEVTDANITPFLSLIGELDYRIGDIYPDQGYANYIAVPNHRGEID